MGKNLISRLKFVSNIINDNIFRRYCAEHSRKALAMRMRSGRQRAPKETADTLLQSLNHYLPHPGKVINPFGDYLVYSILYPTLQCFSLEDIDAARLNTSVARVLDLASDSDSEPSEGGNVTLDAAWSGDSESEGDSADSDMDDPLRYFFSTRVELIYSNNSFHAGMLVFILKRRLSHKLRRAWPGFKISMSESFAVFSLNFVSNAVTTSPQSKRKKSL